MKSICFIISVLVSFSVFAKDDAKVSRKPSSVESKCIASLEGTARTVSIATGMSRVDAVGTANTSELNGSSVVVYIGAHASFDRYEFAISNFQSCTIKGFSMAKAE